MIDLQSDTVTTPSREMLLSCLKASFKDAFLAVDESTRGLEERCAKLFGFEDALLLISGTISNQIALKTHTTPGDSVLLDETYHINYYEAAATSIISRVHLNTIKTLDGIIEPCLLDEVINGRNRSAYNNRITLLCLENSINYHSGKIYPYNKLLEVSRYAKTNGWKIHLDGARIFNVLVEEKILPDAFSKIADSMAVSLNKGLGAPFGSILLGSNSFIKQAKIFNKWIGGGLHQPGMLAEMGLYALTNNFLKIKKDNDNAKLLYSMLMEADLNNISISYPETNIIMLDLTKTRIPAKKLVDALKIRMVYLYEWSYYVVRGVTNLNVNREDIKVCAKTIISEIKLLAHLTQ